MRGVEIAGDEVAWSRGSCGEERWEVVRRILGSGGFGVEGVLGRKDLVL